MRPRRDGLEGATCWVVSSTSTNWLLEVGSGVSVPFKLEIETIVFGRHADGRWLVVHQQISPMHGEPAHQWAVPVRETDAAVPECEATTPDGPSTLITRVSALGLRSRCLAGLTWPVSVSVLVIHLARWESRRRSGSSLWWSASW